MHTIDLIVNDNQPPVEINLAEPVAAPAMLMGGPRWLMAGIALLAVIAMVSLLLSWMTQQRTYKIEQELVRRQQDSHAQASAAHLLAKQSQESALESAAKVALLEARLAEFVIQRSQLENLIESLSRSRDENLVLDIDSGLRMAQQQSAINGSAEPLVVALKQADERLARYSQPRLDGVRRAIARDLDRVRAAGVADISTLTIKLDEVVRLIDELPMLSQAEPRKTVAKVEKSALTASAPSVPMSGPTALTNPSVWVTEITELWGHTWRRVWDEASSLVRVTRIEHPEAVLLAPEQAFFVRANLKLRLLNARLSIFSRQFDSAQSELKVVQALFEKYLDNSSRRTGVAVDLVKQVAAGARQVVLPRLDDTMAALAAASR